MSQVRYPLALFSVACSVANHMHACATVFPFLNKRALYYDTAFVSGPYSCPFVSLFPRIVSSLLIHGSCMHTPHVYKDKV